MKKLTIGRNNSCDIVIPDTSDLVSRKQAILTCTFWGKMVLYDTSNNGTYINGTKLENGKGRRVTRKDKINFAQVADLDWNEVEDPYRTMKLITLIGAVVLLIVAALFAWWMLSSHEEKELLNEPLGTEEVMEKGETTTTVEPKIEEKPQPKQLPVQEEKKVTPKQKQDPIKKMINKEVNNHTPIIY